ENRLVYFTYNKAGAPVGDGTERQSAPTLARGRFDGGGAPAHPPESPAPPSITRSGRISICTPRVPSDVTTPRSKGSSSFTPMVFKGATSSRGTVGPAACGSTFRTT